jgi:hypothetical protein
MTTILRPLHLLAACEQKNRDFLNEQSRDLPLGFGDVEQISTRPPEERGLVVEQLLQIRNEQTQRFVILIFSVVVDLKQEICTSNAFLSTVGYRCV